MLISSLALGGGTRFSWSETRAVVSMMFIGCRKAANMAATKPRGASQACGILTI